MKQSGRILVAGVGPLPPEAPERLFAPGLRVWGIARGLALAGYEVRLATLRAFGEAKPSIRFYDVACGVGWVSDPTDIRHVEDPTYAVSLVERAQLSVGADNSIEEILAGEIEAFRPDALVGTSDIMNGALAKAARSLPLWCDYDGDPMAERQMLAHLFGSDDGLSDQWAVLAPAFARGDRFSGTTRHQTGALMGQLAVAGRLNSRTATTPLVHRIPIWVKPVPPGDDPGPFVRGVVAPADAFLIVQTGGFNTWLDAPGLFAALEGAMARDPRIHFACTGGAIPGHNEKTFAEFERLIDASEFRDRFHRLGWLPLGQVPRVLAECDLAINVDLPSAEGWLGNRNRLFDWMLAGLPVVSTIGSEVAEDLARRGYLFGAPQSDPAAVADAMMKVVADPAAARAMAAAGADYLREAHDPARCLAPLIEWARNPARAADLLAWERGEAPPPALHTALRGDGAILSELQKCEIEIAHAEARLHAMNGSRLMRAALTLRRWLART